MNINKIQKTILYIIFGNFGLYWLDKGKSIGHFQLILGIISLFIVLNVGSPEHPYILSLILFINIILWLFSIYELLFKYNN